MTTKAALCAGWPALSAYITRELREARKAKRKAERACAKQAVEYWVGNIVALVNLRKAFSHRLNPSKARCQNPIDARAETSNTTPQ